MATEEVMWEREYSVSSRPQSDDDESSTLSLAENCEKNKSRFRKAVGHIYQNRFGVEEVQKAFEKFRSKTDKWEAEVKFLGQIQDFLKSDDPSRFFSVLHDREDGPRLNDGWWTHFNYTPTPDTVDVVKRIGCRIERILSTMIQEDEENRDSDYVSDLSSTAGSSVTPDNDERAGLFVETRKTMASQYSKPCPTRVSSASSRPVIRTNQLTAARHEFLQEQRSKVAAGSKNQIRMPRMEICTESLLDGIRPMDEEVMTSDDEEVAVMDEVPVKLTQNENEGEEEESDEDDFNDREIWPDSGLEDYDLSESDSQTDRDDENRKDYFTSYPDGGKKLNRAAAVVTPSTTDDSLRSEVVMRPFNSVEKVKPSVVRSSPNIHFTPRIDKVGVVHRPQPHSSNKSSNQDYYDSKGKKERSVHPWKKC